MSLDTLENHLHDELILYLVSSSQCESALSPGGPRACPIFTPFLVKEVSSETKESSLMSSGKAKQRQLSQELASAASSCLYKALASLVLMPEPPSSEIAFEIF